MYSPLGVRCTSAVRTLQRMCTAAEQRALSTKSMGPQGPYTRIFNAVTDNPQPMVFFLLTFVSFASIMSTVRAKYEFRTYAANAEADIRIKDTQLRYAQKRIEILRAAALAAGADDAALRTAEERSGVEEREAVSTAERSALIERATLRFGEASVEQATVGSRIRSLFSFLGGGGGGGGGGADNEGSAADADASQSEDKEDKEDKEEQQENKEKKQQEEKAEEEAPAAHTPQQQSSANDGNSGNKKPILW